MLNKKFCLIPVIFLFLFLVQCSKKHPPVSRVPSVVTGDIQIGIEKYIDDQTKRGNGYFKFRAKDKVFSFKLVRVHTEYLATLGPHSHFACVDLVDTKGDVYDVDFFLSGDPGNMDVTGTTIHKLNGIPFYTWRQRKDKTWEKVPVEKATKDLLGVISGRDTFEFNYFVQLPAISGKARIWLPFPRSDAFQTITLKMIKTPKKYRILTEKKYGNTILFLKLEQDDSKKSIEIVYTVQRVEKSAYSASKEEAEKYLKGNALVPVYDYFAEIAKKAIKGKKGRMVQARALYDHVIDKMRYAKYGKGWGKGSAVYACDNGNGNCTDYHSLFISLARSVKIPARFAIGAAIPSSRNEGGINGYHCWAEFYADGKWWPVDISEADKYTSLATYYFGHQPANRIELSRGRDLGVEPGPSSGPINFLAYPVLEVNGKKVTIKPEFSFHRL